MMTLRHAFLCVYFCIKLYIHGLLEMLLQPFKRVHLDTIHLDDMRLSGTVALCTGGNTGIGLALCKLLLQYEVTVVIAALNPIAKEEMTPELEKATNIGRLRYLRLDLASFVSIDTFVANFKSRHKSLRFLINNAGVMLVPQLYTKEGFEMHAGVNLIGHAYLIKLMLPLLKIASTSSDKSVIINVSSSVNKLAPVELLLSGRFLSDPPFFSAHLSYALSKLGVRVYTEELANQLRRLAPNIRVNSVHPGVVSTHLYRHVLYPLQVLQKYIMAPVFFRSPECGAQVVLNCLTDIDCTSGAYTDGDDYRLVDISDTQREKLWHIVWQQINRSKRKV